MGSFASFEGKTVVVTGAAQGIGEAIAQRLADLGAGVAVLDVDEEGARTVARKLRDSGADAAGIHCDIRSEDSVRDALSATRKELGPIDVLVNNAGINAYADPVEMTSEEWDRLFAVDLKGSFFCAKHVLPEMKERRRGSIVNIASVHAQMTTPGMFPYAACKSGLVGLTRSLALEAGPHQIRVNSVSPGYTLTRLVEEYFDKVGDERLSKENVLASHAMGRMATPHEIANVVAFVASDEASFMTGSDVVVDGGLTSRFAP